MAKSLNAGRRRTEKQRLNEQNYWITRAEAPTKSPNIISHYHRLLNGEKKLLEAYDEIVCVWSL